MNHVVLLGDSIFDNASYTRGGPDVIAQVRERLPTGWRGTLLAVDGATTRGIAPQLERLPSSASHLVLSAGGNDALGAAHILGAPARTVGHGLHMLADAVAEFEQRYRDALQRCLRPGLPLAICTIYNGRFEDPAYQRQVTAALTAYNDVIIRAAVEHTLPVIDLRVICSRPEDYANPIEPSSIGGAKIAQAIVDVVTGAATGRQTATLIGN